MSLAQGASLRSCSAASSSGRPDTISTRWHAKASRPQRRTAIKASESSVSDAGVLQEVTSQVQDAIAKLGNDGSWQGLEPHFGSAAINRALGGTGSWFSTDSGLQLPFQLPQLPQLPSQLPQLPSFSGAGLPSFPHVELPSQLPQMPHFDAPEFELPYLGGASSSAEQAMARLAALQQTIAQQLSALAAPPGASYQPHFGSAALQAILSQANVALKDALTALPTVDLSGANTVLDAIAEARASATAAAAAATQGLATSPLVVASTDALQQLQHAAQSSVGAAVSSLGGDPTAATASLAALAQALRQLPQTGIAGYDVATVALIAAGAAAAIAASVPSEASAQRDTLPEFHLGHDYSPQAAAEYFRRRPVAVARRAAQVALHATRFGLAILLDIWPDNVKVNEYARAVQLRQAIESLGPAYVKVAQALSTRVDLLPPEYFNQIQLLQDRVPPFPCDEAKQVMADAFGRPVERVFSYLSERPVAAASLGQVYRATLRAELGGGDVAVKVQRPDVLDQVALDLYLMRHIALALERWRPQRTRWSGVIDNWAVRFLHEMDYSREAQNSIRFKQQMSGLTGIVVPDVVPELSSDMVLTTAWQDGEKLSDSRAPDVRELCNTLLNCYLIQLLETGWLHADPHPGNLIRTPEGKICILDYGLMTEVTPEQQVALVEYIAHLSTQDWESVALDLRTLGFIPASFDPRASGLVEPLGAILSQLVVGGGAAKVNIELVTAQLEDLSRNYPFEIPPFFTLILRAFSVIEGIALSSDPDYAIVKECFPYISRRLLADDDPRLQKALKDVLYGGKQRLDVERLLRLADGFATFTTNGLTEGQRGGVAVATVGGSSSGDRVVTVVDQRAVARLDPAAKEALRAIFSERGSYVQELLVDEVVAAVDALSREALSEVFSRVLRSAPAMAAMTTVQALGPLRGVLLPLPTPLEIMSRLAPTVAITEEDREALGVVRGVFQLLDRATPPSARGDPTWALRSLADTASELQPMLPELLPGVWRTTQLLVRATLRRLALRVAQSVAARPGDEEAAMMALDFLDATEGLDFGVGPTWGHWGGDIYGSHGQQTSTSQTGGRRSSSDARSRAVAGLITAPLLFMLQPWQKRTRK